MTPLKSRGCLLFAIIFLFSVSITAAQNKVVVVPLFDDEASCCACEGTLNGTRWCDNGDGTVTDLSTCLVWLKTGGCYIHYSWNTATIWVSRMSNGACGLSDGSTQGDWRLPTFNELWAFFNGNEAVRSDTPRAFTNLPNSDDYPIIQVYWSSITDASDDGFARVIESDNSTVYSVDKSVYAISWAWPVHGGND